MLVSSLDRRRACLLARSVAGERACMSGCVGRGGGDWSGMGAKTTKAPPNLK